MHIIRDQTPGFEHYEVFVTKQRIFLWWLPWDKPEIKIDNVLEADDATGLVVRHVVNEYMEPVFTNGIEDISLSNECKLLLLMPPMRQAFLQFGFVPKVIRTYEKNVRIVNRNPTVAIAVNVQQQLEQANA